jgi:hypothetical protein
MIFPHLELEPVVQVNDRTRLSAAKSFVTQDQGVITAIQIKPSASADFINVTSDGYLDWAYAASGVVNVTARVSVSGASAEITRPVEVLTVAQDHLFSTDSDLKLHEPDILKWVESGRNSFLNMHRRAQTLILKDLRREGYTDINGVPYTKAAFIDVEEVKQWSTMWALEIIFEGMSNATDDVFHEKAVRYSALRQRWSSIMYLRLDQNGDGEASRSEGIDTAAAFVARR